MSCGPFIAALLYYLGGYMLIFAVYTVCIILSLFIIDRFEFNDISAEEVEVPFFSILFSKVINMI
jgi:hypothetical protein